MNTGKMNQEKPANFDAIIVGAGLAGSLLGYQLLQRGKKVLMFDAGPEHRASAVAAGIVNPMVFRRLLKTWLADELVPFVFQYYPELEQELNIRAFFPTRFLKLLSPEEKAFWEKSALLNDTQPYLSPAIAESDALPGLAPCDGLGEVFQAGWLDINSLLNAMHQRFRQQNILRDDAFAYTELKIEKEGVSYQQILARKIIFCEGTGIAQNPWFNLLPFKPAKGEVLTIRSNNFRESSILNRNGFVLPLGGGLYKVGVTYSWDQNHQKPTGEGRAQLLQIAENILRVPFEVVHHEAGIRPASNDRRPVLGAHPLYPQLCVFNGLGSKGVLLAPWFVHHLADHLYENQPLMPEVDVKRYGRFFSQA